MTIPEDTPNPPARHPEALPCPFCGATMARIPGFMDGSPFWEHPFEEPCIVRGVGISIEGLSMWNRRAGEAGQ